jgi:spore coat protein U-like protein
MRITKENKGFKLNTIVKKKNSKKVLAKSTTALTCMLSAAMIYASLETANATTTTGTFTVSTNVGSVCTFSVSGAMSFGAYVPSANSDATVNVMQNCTVGTTGVVTFLTEYDAAGSAGDYRLYLGGNATASTSGFLTATFGKTAYGSDLLYLGSNSFSAAGTGSEASIGTIYGRVASGQYSRSVGAFTRAITLVVTY